MQSIDIVTGIFFDTIPVEILSIINYWINNL